MKLVMTLLVRDEADIVAENIEFHLNAGVDHIIATDNLSVDGTTEILRGYEALGVLHYIAEPEDDYSQHRWVTRMALLAATEFGADWVINNDADEFWMAELGDLKSTLADAAPDVVAMRAERYNFLPPPSDSEGPFHQRMLVREKVSLNALGRPLPGKVCHRGLTDIAIDQGNHSVRQGGRALPSAPLAADILHYPLRSYEQFANKIIKGGAAYARNRELPSSTGGTWRKLHEDWMAGLLEERFAEAQRPPDDVRQGLVSGELLVDLRVRDAISALQPLQPVRR